ncbi:MAG: RluA family pseudouridine synthase, partial [Chloroflexi bacterium]|nr:RluA family pseudouridine synthase [Chloroflexota bacterium]
MTTRTLCVADSQTGQRLDRFLADQTADLSRSQLQRLIREGCVRVDGIDAKPSLRLETGQHVILDIPPPAQLALIPQPMALSIVYDDHDIVVVDKPAGMVVHPGHGVSSGTLVNALIARFPEMCSFADSLRPGIVHRLDKGTSGLIVVAKNPAALLHLQRQFAARTVSKSYWALVHGALSVERGLIEAPIGRNRGRPTQMAIAGRAERPARTAFTVLER